VYRLQTTEALAYNVDPLEMQDALEKLSLVTDVDVSREVAQNGYSWMVTFNGLAPEGPAVPLMVNSVSMRAAPTPSMKVTSVRELIVSDLSNSVSVPSSVAAVNSFGTGSVLNSSPANIAPHAQVPSKPLDVRTVSVANMSIDVQFNTPTFTGGKEISSYVVQWDTESTFDSGRKGAPLSETVISAGSMSRRADVQVVSMYAAANFRPNGTFTMTFKGQSTDELDFNISAAGMEMALEGLTTVGDVAVHRELWCDRSTGVNTCGDERGYVWMVTFVDTLENGPQTQPRSSPQVFTPVERSHHNSRCTATSPTVVRPSSAISIPAAEILKSSSSVL
jgi:hypothetical protein